jgi:hypothetical protein
LEFAQHSRSRSIGVRAAWSSRSIGVRAAWSSR